MRRDEATLFDIVKAARAVLTFIKGLEKETFLNDFKTQSAVLYQLTVIGEAVKRLSFEYRTEAVSYAEKNGVALEVRPWRTQRKKLR